MCFSNTHWPQLTAPFYSILFETSICLFNSSKFSPVMPDEVREHLTRSKTIQNLSRSFRFTAPWRCFFSSVHLTHFLQGSGQRTGMVIAEAWFCAQWPIFVLFLRFVFGLLSGNFFVSSDHRSQSHLKFQTCLITEYAGDCFWMSEEIFSWNPPKQHVVM